MSRQRAVTDDDTATVTVRGRDYVGVRSRLDIANETFVLFRGVDAELQRLLKRASRDPAFDTDRRAIESEIAEVVRFIPQATESEIWPSAPNGPVSLLRLG